MLHCHRKKWEGPYQLDCHGPTVCVRKRWPLLSGRVRSSSFFPTTPLPSSSIALYIAAVRNDKIFFFQGGFKTLQWIDTHPTPTPFHLGSFNTPPHRDIAETLIFSGELWTLKHLMKARFKRVHFGNSYLRSSKWEMHSPPGDVSLWQPIQKMFTRGGALIIDPIWTNLCLAPKLNVVLSGEILFRHFKDIFGQDPSLCFWKDGLA